MRRVAALALLALALTGCPRGSSSGTSSGTPPGEPGADPSAGKSGGSAGPSATGPGGAQAPVTHTSESKPAQALGGANLLVNAGGDAERVVVKRATDGDTLGPPGWELGSGVELGGYGATDRITAETPGPAARGDNYFGLLVGSRGASAQAAARQTIDVSSAAAEIDAGGVRCAIGGWFERDANAYAQLVATFLDEAGKSLGEVKTEEAPYTEAVAFVERRAEGDVPAKTRRIRVTLQAVGTAADADTNGTAWADQLEVVLRKR